MLEKVWKEQEPGFYNLALKSPSGKWQDFFFEDIKSALRWIKEKQGKGDIYFCTTTLSDKHRKKGYVQSSRYLWQDLDEVDPSSLGTLKPTIAWQSSPGRYQALWRLDGLYEPKRIEAINKALAQKVKADQGSWILTKVLRVPGTTNYKYPKKPQVKTLWSDGKTYKINNLERRLSTEPSRERELPKKASELEYEKVYAKYRNIIPRKVRRLLNSDTATKGKRSDVLWFIEHELIKVGLSHDEVYTLVKGSVWNKYRGREDEEIRLMTEIDKASSEVGEVEEKLIELDTDSDDEDITFKLTVQNDLELMTDIYQYPGWMVEGFWTRKSHGIVAGEPKSFKSTLVLDMAVSIASGRKFLGEFEVVDSGPVLIVQNENAAWIMKDRLSKIRTAKGLIGEVSKHDNIYQIKFPVELPIYYINQQGFNFNEKFHRKLLDNVMRSIQPHLVIFDPLYLMFDGDVNTSKELNPILTWLLGLKDYHNCSEIVIHHWKKGTAGTKLRGGQRMLGSTTLHGWVESAWYLDVKKSDDLEEEIFSDELNAPSGSATLTLEREFRGAGTYPKLDMIINMGDFGSTDYNVKIQRHRKERGGVDETEAKKQIKEIIDLREGNVTMRELSKELGISRKIASKLYKEIQEENNG